MKLILYILIILAVILQLSSNTIIPHIGKPHGQTPPRFQLNLDLPPQERWKPIVKHYKPQLFEIYASLNWFLGPWTDIFFDLFSFWAEYMFQYQELTQEVKGISEETGIPFGKMMFIQFIYEFTTISVISPKMCSSIIVRNSTGNILHGRNMDFEIWNRVSPLAAYIDVYRGGKYVTTMDSLVGTVFALTGFKPHKFGISEDTRPPRNGTFADIILNLFVNNYVPSAWLIRQVLIEEETYAAARERLMMTDVSSPIYYIISGISGNQGTVIEKQPVGVHAVYDLNETTWFYVQTNYDRDLPDPWWDQRRTPAEQRLKQMGQNINIQDLYNNVTTKWPTFNIATIITLSAVPSTGYQNLTAWYGVVNPNATKIDQQ